MKIDTDMLIVFFLFFPFLLTTFNLIHCMLGNFAYFLSSADFAKISSINL